MARGWESKSVESQQEEAEERRRLAGLVPQSPEEIAREKEKESLLLSRTRVQQDLERSRNERHRGILRAALAHLEAKLAALR